MGISLRLAELKEFIAKNIDKSSLSVYRKIREMLVVSGTAKSDKKAMEFSEDVLKKLIDNACKKRDKRDDDMRLLAEIADNKELPEKIRKQAFEKLVGAVNQINYEKSANERANIIVHSLAESGAYESLFAVKEYRAFLGTNIPAEVGDEDIKKATLHSIKNAEESNDITALEGVAQDSRIPDPAKKEAKKAVAKIIGRNPGDDILCDIVFSGLDARLKEKAVETLATNFEVGAELGNNTKAKAFLKTVLKASELDILNENMLNTIKDSFGAARQPGNKLSEGVVHAINEVESVLGKVEKKIKMKEKQAGELQEAKFIKEGGAMEREQFREGEKEKAGKKS